MIKRKCSVNYLFNRFNNRKYNDSFVKNKHNAFFLHLFNNKKMRYISVFP